MFRDLSQVRDLEGDIAVPRLLRYISEINLNFYQIYPSYCLAFLSSRVRLKLHKLMKINPQRIITPHRCTKVFEIKPKAEDQSLSSTIALLFRVSTSGNLSYFYCGGIAAVLQAKLHLLVNMGISTHYKLSNREREGAYKCITDG